MASSENGWDNFWQNQKESFNQAMKISTIFFAKKMEEVFKLKGSDQILDYGAGPGFLADYFERKNIFITSADINKFFIDQSKNRKFPFIHITTDVNTNKQIFDDAFREKKFDFITLLSVVQYFKSAADVEDVIKLLLPFISENGRLIIADVISQKTTALSDASSLFLQCAKEVRLITFFRFILYLIFSDYRKHRMQTRLLTLEDENIKEIADKLSLNFEIVKGLTLHSQRTSYVLTKRSRQLIK